MNHLTLCLQPSTETDAVPWTVHVLVVVGILYHVGPFNSEKILYRK